MDCETLALVSLAEWVFVQASRRMRVLNGVTVDEARTGLAAHSAMEIELLLSHTLNAQTPAKSSRSIFGRSITRTDSPIFSSVQEMFMTLKVNDGT